MKQTTNAGCAAKYIKQFRFGKLAVSEYTVAMKYRAAHVLNIYG